MNNKSKHSSHISEGIYRLLTIAGKTIFALLHNQPPKKGRLARLLKLVGKEIEH